MSEQTEWEVVDAPAARAHKSGANWMEATLGRYWKLKVAGLAITGLAILVFVVMLTGVVLVVLAGVALLMLAAAKVRQLVRRHRHPNRGMQRHENAPDWKPRR